MTSPNWSKADDKLLREIVDAGERKLDAQVQLATSADQRASVLAGIYAAVATGLVASVASGWNDLPEKWIVGDIIAAIAFLIAAFLCVLAILPADFWTPGLEPEEWYDDLATAKDPKLALGEYAEHISRHISENTRCIVRNAKLFRWGALIGLGAPLIGLLLAGVIFLWA